MTCGKIVFFPPLPFSFLLQPKMWRLNTKSRFSKIKPILGSIILSAAHVDFEGLRGRGVWGVERGGGFRRRREAQHIQ